MKNFSDEIAVLVACSDKYYELIPGFIYFFEKNMPFSSLDVYYSLEKKKFDYKRSNFNFVNSNSTYWSERIYTTLRMITQEYVMVLLDDYWFLDYADKEQIESFFNFALNNNVQHISYLDKKEDYFHELVEYETTTNFSIYTCSKGKLGHQYLLGVGGIYNKKFLQSILRKYESAWDFETEASFRYSKFIVQKNYRFYSLSNPFTYPYGGIIHKGKIRTSIKEKLELINYHFEWIDQRVNVSTNDTPLTIRILRKTIRYFFKLTGYRFGKFND